MRVNLIELQSGYSQYGLESETFPEEEGLESYLDTGTWTAF